MTTAATIGNEPKAGVPFDACVAGRGVSCSNSHFGLERRGGAVAAGPGSAGVSPASAFSRASRTRRRDAGAPGKARPPPY